MKLKTLILLAVGAFAGAAVAVSFSSIRMLHAEQRPDRQIASAPGSRFSGKVDVHFVDQGGVNDLFQLVDQDHRVICYGRMTPGGSSTISCQRF